MFSHIMVGAKNVQESKVFYDAVLGALGYEPGVIDEKGRCFYLTRRGNFAITKPIDGEPACHGNGSTTGFSAKIRRKWMPGIQWDSLMVGRLVKIHLEYEKER
jgi:catechol 2,3-dioxygenase-like lactoylglutathione lyase family enzyme